MLERPTSTYPTPTRARIGREDRRRSPPSEGVITVSRLLTDGAPDPTFDGDGRATIESAGFPSAHALAVQPDGKILLVGFTNIERQRRGRDGLAAEGRRRLGRPQRRARPHVRHRRHSPAQHRSPTPSDSPSRSSRTARSSPRGRGFNTTGPNMVAVWRLTEGGALDPTFDTDGVAEISDTTEDSVNAIALAPDGKILIAGTTELCVGPTRRGRLAAQGQRRNRRPQRSARPDVRHRRPGRFRQWRQRCSRRRRAPARRQDPARRQLRPRQAKRRRRCGG